MGCFTLGWLEQLLVWLVIIGAIIAVIRILVPLALSFIGIPAIAQVVNIILWAIIIILVIYVCFALLGCLVGGVHLLH